MLLLYQGGCKCIRRKNFDSVAVQRLLNQVPINNIISLPVVLHHTPRLSANDRNEEYRALLDTGANSSFISTKRVKELGLEIDAFSGAVKNGDGSKQLSPGTVQVTFSIGSRFKTTA
jgi:hypothetical protein